MGFPLNAQASAPRRGWEEGRSSGVITELLYLCRVIAMDRGDVNRVNSDEDLDEECKGIFYPDQSLSERPAWLRR
jgi:hypothetical protein